MEEKHRRTRQPREAPQGVQIDPSILMGMAENMGRLAEASEQTTRRLDDLTTIQRDQASSFQELREENSQQHYQTARDIGILGADLKGVFKRLDTLEEAVHNKPGPRDGKGDSGTSARAVSEAFTFVKQWWPILVAGGMAVGGAIYGFLFKWQSGP